jgi:hypothetical protein
MKNLKALIISLTIFSLAGNAALSAEFIFGPASPQIPTDNNQLYLVGEIVPGDYDRFVEAIKKHQGNYFALHLRSGGGHLQEAMRIGRLVRQLLVSTYAAAPFPDRITERITTTWPRLRDTAFFVVALPLRGSTFGRIG